jgi:hypothetical protein
VTQTTQSATPATLPPGVALALDVVGSASAPATGDSIPYSKLDIGVAGASSPVTAANPLPVSLPAGLATGTLVGGTAKPIFSFEKTNAAVTVKIRRIVMSGYATSALAGQLDFQINRGTAASTGGAAATVNGGPRVTGDSATIATMKSLPTIVAATVVDSIPGFVVPTTTATGQGFTIIYDWQEAGETKPWTLVSGSIDALVINVISGAALAFNLSCHIVYTEE